MKKRAISVLLVLVLVFSVLPISSLAAAPDYDPYTALGDSITTGFTFAGGYVTSYVELAALDLGVSFSNDAILAMDSSDLYKLLNVGPQASFFGYDQQEEYAYIQGDISDSDLITVAIGSNDLTMTVLDMIYQCIYPFIHEGDVLCDEDLEAFTPMDHVIALNEVVATINRIRDCFEDMNNAPAATMTTEGTEGLTAESMPPEIPDDIREMCDALAALTPAGRLQTAVDNFKTYWDGIIGKLRGTRPNATIAAIGFYNPYPNTIDLGNGQVIDLSLQCYIDQMNAYISGADGTCGVADEYYFVDLENPTVIEICSNGDPHPTAAGHVEIANRLLAKLPDSIPDPPVYYYTAASYSIEATASAGGSISPSGRTAVTAGTNSTFKITPDADFVIDYVLVDDVKVDKTTAYTFKNVQANHKIYVAFKQNPFIDVGINDWFHDEVLYLFSNDLINGVTAITFEPETSTSRAMIAQLLYRMANSPDVNYQAVYPDVAENAWYADAVMWAAQNGIIAGYENGKFGPEDVITREQLVTSLFNFANYMHYDTSASKQLTAYADSASVSDWAKEAMQWAVAIGLIKGTSEDQLSPDGASTRAVVAAIFQRFLEKY